MQGPDEHGGRRWNAMKPKNTRNWFQVKWGEWIGNIDCPLMQRWVVETPIGSLRVHHFLHSDDDRALHDHPWWFVTFPLGSGYIDVTYCRACEGGGVVDGWDCQFCGGDGRLRTHVPPWRFTFRPARHAHAVATDGCWTLIVTGRKRRDWGFWPTARKWLESRPYFHKFGFAPCQD